MEQEQLEEEKSHQSESNDCTDENSMDEEEESELEENGDVHLRRLLSTKPINGDVITQTGTRRPPHNYVYIVKDAVEPFDMSSTEKICEQLYEGVLLNGRKKMYWVDSVLNKNRFMVLARDLGIVHSENSEHWAWYDCVETRNASIEVALLKAVSWLEINGKFQTITLAPNTSYEVAFVVMMVDSSYDWNIPVDFKITFPDGREERCTHSFRELPKMKWIDLPICKFTMSPENVGEIAFSLLEPSGQWKKGVVIKGVSFWPKD